MIEVKANFKEKPVLFIRVGKEWVMYPERLLPVAFRKLLSYHRKGEKVVIEGDIAEFERRFNAFLDREENYSEILKQAKHQLVELDKQLPFVNWEEETISTETPSQDFVLNPVNVEARKLAKKLGLHLYERNGGVFPDFRGDQELRKLFWKVAKKLARLKYKKVIASTKQTFYVKKEG